MASETIQMDGLFISALTDRLQGPKPGLEAQIRMCPDPRPGTQPVERVEHECAKAGVLALLYPHEDRLHLVLTLRTNHLESHQGQISFPGGKQEPGESLEEAALRETQEELGISTESIRLLGSLTPLYIPVSRFCIYPIVAVSDSRPDFHPSPDEVDEVIEVPLDHLLDSQNTLRETWVVQGRELDVPFYSYRKYKIWGATAMIMAELMALIDEKQTSPLR